MSLCILVFIATALSAQVPVRHQEGLVHGFLALRTLQGETIADGDLIQNVRGDRVTSRLVFILRMDRCMMRSPSFLNVGSSGY